MAIDDTSDFTKQRRNLILISCVLLLHDILGIQYEDFKIFDMKITKAENLSWIIWVIWGYFLIRYFNLFFEKESTLIKPVTTIFENYQKNIIEKYYYDVKGQIVTKIDFIDRGKSTLGYKVKLNNNHEFIHDKIDFKEYLDNFSMIKFSIFTAFSYIFKTHYFFEYYFPILFASLPLFWVILKTLGDLVS